MSDAFIVILTSVFNLFLGVLVILRNPRSLVNRVFVAFILSLVVWSGFNYLADQAADHNLIYTRLTFSAATFIGLTLYWLSLIFPTGQRLAKTKFAMFQIVASILVAGISLSPYVVTRVEKLTERVGIELFIGPLYYIYLLYILQIFGAIVWNFVKRIKKTSFLERAQIKFMFLGICLYAVSAIVSNLILPLVMDSWSSSRFGPVFTLLFVVFTSYAIIRHKLLDIRLIVVRSIGYILLLGTLTAIYILAAFVIAGRFFDGEVITKEVAPLVTAIFLVFTAPSLRRLFNKLTDKLFYRDAYDTQLFLDELNNTLVSNIEVAGLLKNSAKVIAKNFKAEHCFIYLNGDLYAASPKHAKDIEHHFDEMLGTIEKELTKKGKEILVADAVEDSSLASRLHQLSFEVIAKVGKFSEQYKDFSGYLVLGPKQSGNIYTKEDIALVEIMSNELLIASQNALRYKEIQTFTNTLQDKVSAATKELRQTNEKLKALDETKDEFISMASHQLRTPLTSVKGYLSMVLEGDAGGLNEQQKKLLSQAFTSSQRMVYLIADLLNVSRLRTGKFIIEPTATNLAEVIDGEIGQLTETAQVRGLELRYEKPQEFPVVYLDETKIRQVIMNFIDNAIYYTPAGGHIVVSLTRNDQAIEFKVVDDGLGVPKAEQHHLFTKFYRAKNARRARPDGTGLGLFMAKKVIVAQGGALLFKSQEGKGSTFGFTFPRSVLEAPRSTKKA